MMDNQVFEIAGDGVDPRSVPKRVLYDGTEMPAIESIDRNCRLIKGQVFLWKDGQTWEDLWDPSGEITPA